MNSDVSPLCTIIDGAGGAAGFMIQAHACGVAVMKNNRLISLVTISVEMAQACAFWQGREEGDGEGA